MFASSGEVLHITALPGDDIKITNPYPKELVSFIQVWLKNTIYSKKQRGSSTNRINIEERNRLLQPGDALRLEKVQSEMEFEALSQDALFLLIESI
ncbi:MAG: hypothetical protein QM640_01190 [Niabella sp.]